MSDGPGLIFSKMAAILSEFPVVAKERSNPSQGYKFRGIDDVYKAAQPLLAKHGVFPVPTHLDLTFSDAGETASKKKQWRAEVHGGLQFTASDGSYVYVSIVGEGIDTGDKAGMKAISNAVKYGYWNTFCVPSDEVKDSEAYADDDDDSEPAYEPRSKR